jgi:putative PIN family toxin of toxin-antitoxin system
MKVMFDTNIYLSVYLFRSQKLFDMLKQTGEQQKIIVSEIVLEEVLGKIFEYTSGKEGFTNELISKVYSFITKKAEVKIFYNHIKHNKVDIRDKNDTNILQSFLESDADIFVTGDKDFLSIKKYSSKIMSPTDFMLLELN